MQAVCLSLSVRRFPTEHLSLFDVLFWKKSMKVLVSSAVPENFFFFDTNKYFVIVQTGTNWVHLQVETNLAFLPGKLAFNVM